MDVSKIQGPLKSVLSELYGDGAAAHTPGPLYPRQNSAGMWELHIENSAYAHSTAFVCSPEENAEADARLYAAAPDLLVALRDCVAVMSAEWNGLAVIQLELRQARAAIAKATGSAA